MTTKEISSKFILGPVIPLHEDVDGYWHARSRKHQRNLDLDEYLVYVKGGCRYSSAVLQGMFASERAKYLKENVALSIITSLSFNGYPVDPTRVKQRHKQRDRYMGRTETVTRKAIEWRATPKSQYSYNNIGFGHFRLLAPEGAHSSRPEEQVFMATICAIATPDAFKIQSDHIEHVAICFEECRDAIEARIEEWNEA